MWYYVLNGQQQGPLTREALAQKLNGEIAADTLVWKEGMADWIKANELEEFLNFAVAPSTPPPPLATPSNNPYAAPAVAHVQHTPTGDYPLPQVKPARFGLLLTSSLLGFFGIIACVFTFFLDIGTAYNSAHPNSSSEVNPDNLGGIFSPTVIFLSIATIGIFIWSTVLGMMYVYRAWTILQPAGASTTPGKAVGFLFIPFFNYYWAFIAYWKWAQEWNATCNRYHSLQFAPRGSEGSFLAMAICQCVSLVFSLAGLGHLIMYYVGMKSMCDVINHAAAHAKQSDANPFR